ncbi:hypothetical protein CCH79_00001328 [Gambusia affinis]|uniref:Ig-like domain-containing protein n=1 Tax=Gambusia affinis TaxID=33528 RepID=A0A315VQ60_GAMAF|nr:hypothetical protein CCH79_00001328 [Gambusia affinis]
MTCSSSAKPPVSLFTWFRNSTNGKMQVAKGDVYGFNITEEGIYHCVATNDLGNQTSPEVHLTGPQKGELEQRQQDWRSGDRKPEVIRDDVAEACGRCADRVPPTTAGAIAFYADWTPSTT